MKSDISEEKIIVEKDGKVKECDVLFSFDSNDTMKSYIGYTDQEIAKNGRKNIYVSSYDFSKPTITLENITDEKELDMINQVLVELDNSVNG